MIDTDKRLPMRGAARAVTLIEMMATLGILSAFAIVATELSVMSLNVPARAAERENVLVHEAGAMEQLRQNVWSAEAVEVGADGQSVRLRSAGSEVRWSLSREGTLALGGDAATVSDEEPGPVKGRVAHNRQVAAIMWKSFAAHPAGLELRGERTAGDLREHSIILSSPLRIAQLGERP